MAASGDGAAGGRAKLTPGLMALTIALACGVWVSSLMPQEFLWCGVVIAAASLVAGGLALRGRRNRVGRWCLVLACAGLGAARYALKERPALVDAGAPKLAHLTGAVVSNPVTRAGAVGPMAQFSHRGLVTCFDLRVEGWGTVVVRVGEPVPDLDPGDVIEVRGLLHRPQGPVNPGGFDGVRAARARGQVGMLSVPNGDLVQCRYRGAGSRWAKWRSVLRAQAEKGLFFGIDVASDDPRGQLLAALFLGRRSSGQDALSGAFRRVGVGHVLAISGLHLGILAGLVLLVARAGGVPRRGHAAVVIAVVLVYLVLVETRMPVLRAGVMIVAASLGLFAGRRLEARGLMALSAAVLLYRWPHELFDAGFQLSYLVVMALIEVAPAVRHRLFGPPDRQAASVGTMLLEWIKTAWCVAVVAWLVASPLTLHHFGLLSPLGAFLSVLLVPYIAAILALGYVKMVVSLIAPALGALLAVPLLAALHPLIGIVHLFDRVPGAALRMASPGWVWTVSATAWIWILLAGRPRLRGRWHAALAVVVATFLLAPTAPDGNAPALRIDMLAVGNGSCYIVRSAGRVVMFDAGSSSRSDGGARSILASLRHWNIQRVDAIVLSHANFDHYAAVPAIIEEIRVDQVLITPQLERAGHDPDGAVAYVLKCLEQRRIPVKTIAAGYACRIGHARWNWLHPPADQRFERTNDASMVVRIEVAGRAVLLTGDVEAEALTMLSALGPGLQVDVLELPHHGSDTVEARQFVQMADPSVVLQSTGWSRWRMDTWGEDLGAIQRLVTARDGACTVDIGRCGQITTSRFVLR